MYLIRLVPVTLVMGTIFFLSHQSGDTLDLPSFPGADKLAHMTAYGTLACTVLWSFGRKGLDNPGRTVVLTLLFCVLYGISDEYHQSFTPLRSVSVLDVFADTAGALCVTLLWFQNLPLRQKIISYQERIQGKIVKSGMRTN